MYYSVIIILVCLLTIIMNYVCYWERNEHAKCEACTMNDVLLRFYMIMI
jgi:hypothetical protein